MPWWGELIYDIGRWITVFPILIGLYRLKHLNHKTLSVFIWMCSMLLIQLYSANQSKLGINNNPSGHLMIFFNALFSGWFFYFAVESKRMKTTILISWICLLFFLIVYPLAIVNVLHDSNFSMTIQAYGLMVWGLIYLFDLLKKEEILNLFQSAEFLIVVGILLYFGTTQIMRLLETYTMWHMKEVHQSFRYVDISIMIVYYFLIGIGLWKKKLQRI